jgi:hypothetical protein
MRYWYYDKAAKRATGPHLDLVLIHQPGFGPESQVAPAGAEGGAAPAWKLAKDIPELKALLPAPPPPPPAKKK